MKCYICHDTVTRSQIKSDDAVKLSRGVYVHHDCGMEEGADSLPKDFGALYPYTGTQWGGKRKGSGRKPSPEPLAVISTTIYEKDYRILRQIAKDLDPRRPSLRLAIRMLLDTRAH